jgi:rubredoxin
VGRITAFYTPVRAAGMPPDRRSSERQPNPACPTCRTDGEKVQVTVRTGYLLFFKCSDCGRVWQREKPDPRGQRRWDR